MLVCLLGVGIVHTSAVLLKCRQSESSINGRGSDIRSFRMTQLQWIIGSRLLDGT
jgi:hypothetical protein